MERTLLGTLFGSLLGIGWLGFVWAPPSPPSGPPGKPDIDWHLLEPVTYENLTIFPVASARGADTSGFLTLDEGLSSGSVVVREQGSETIIRDRGIRPVPVPEYQTGASVNRLVLVNRSKRPLLLLAGELVSGGKQDRIISKDRIVPPDAEPLPLDVFCVEHGRWSAGSVFAAANIMVHPSVREKAAVDQKQEQVWDAVRSGTTAAAPAAAPPPPLSMAEISGAVQRDAPTQAYAKIYDSRAVGVPIENFVEEVQKRFAKATSGLKGERVVGVVVAYGSEVAWSDIFASGDLFDHYWNKLLRSYAVEALARPTLREHPSLEEAREFLRPLQGRETQESEPGVYRWREIREGRLAQIDLEALQPREMTLHRLKLHRT